MKIVGIEHTYGPPRVELVTRTFREPSREAAMFAAAANDNLITLGTGETTMVAINPKRIHCVVVSVPIEADLFTARGALAHEMVPGADPYVAQLIRRLQDEVRHERRVEQLNARAGLLTKQARFEQEDLIGDLELPWFDMPLEEEPLGEENLPEFGNEN